MCYIWLFWTETLKSSPVEVEFGAEARRRRAFASASGPFGGLGTHHFYTFIIKSATSVCRGLQVDLMDFSDKNAFPEIVKHGENAAVSYLSICTVIKLKRMRVWQ